MIEMFESLGIGLAIAVCRDLGAADRLLRVAAAGADLDRRRAGVLSGVVVMLSRPTPR